MYFFNSMATTFVELCTRFDDLPYFKVTTHAGNIELKVSFSRSDPIEFKLCVVVTCIAQNVQVPVLSASTKWTTPLCTECFTWLCNAFLVCGYLWQRQCRLLLMFFCQYYMIFTHQCTSAWYAVSFCVVCAARVVTKITIQSHKHRHLVVCVMKESEVI